MRVFAGATCAAAVPIGMAHIADAAPYAQRQITLTKFLNGVELAQILAGPVGGIFGQFFGWRGVFVALAAATLTVVITLGVRLRTLPDPRREGATFSLVNYVTLAQRGLPRLLLPKLGESGLVITGGILMTVVLIIGMISPVWQAFIVVQILLGLGYYMLHAVLQAQATEMLPNARGTAVASFALVLFLGQSVGALAIWLRGRLRSAG